MMIVRRESIRSDKPRRYEVTTEEDVFALGIINGLMFGGAAWKKIKAGNQVSVCWKRTEFSLLFNYKYSFFSSNFWNG